MKLGHVGTYVFDGTMADLGRIDQSNQWAAANLKKAEELRSERKLQIENAKAVEEIETVQQRSESRKERRQKTKKKS